jgi:hypothetical protein
MTCQDDIRREEVVEDKKLLLLDVYQLYESGKHRRYGLLFSVNGGAFALVTFLFKGPSPEILVHPIWLLGIVGGAMIAFSIVMMTDIRSFGYRMRRLGGPLDLFGPIGQQVLTLITILLVGVWAAAIIAAFVSVQSG